ncbi:MAG: hypothetical protein NUW37_04570 [Planctomycetes bacterium]|nr:hypothetical protein [Planctomycetota bacterium]
MKRDMKQQGENETLSIGFLYVVFMGFLCVLFAAASGYMWYKYSRDSKLLSEEEKQVRDMAQKFYDIDNIRDARKKWTGQENVADQQGRLLSLVEGIAQINGIQDKVRQGRYEQYNPTPVRRYHFQEHGVRLSNLPNMTREEIFQFIMKLENEYKFLRVSHLEIRRAQQPNPERWILTSMLIVYREPLEEKEDE